MHAVSRLSLRAAFALLICLLAGPCHAQAFNPDANGDGQIGAGDVIAVLAVYGLPYDVESIGPSVLHFDPDTTTVLPLGYDLYIAEDFTFPYLYVTVPDGEFPGQSFRMAVEKQPDMDDQQVYLQDAAGNWLALARQFETNGRYAELVWTGLRWVSSVLD
jgi:hypothetical protein